MTELQRHMPGWQAAVIKAGLYEAKYGAYTELFCGWSPPDVTAAHNGAYVWPWGRFGGVRSDVQKALLPGGNAEKFWNWCDAESKVLVGWTNEIWPGSVETMLHVTNMPGSLPLMNLE